jgi:hypothetical protein
MNTIDDTTARATAVMMSRGLNPSYLQAFQQVGIISDDVMEEAKAVYAQFEGVDKMVAGNLIEYLREHGNRPAVEGWDWTTRYHYHEDPARLRAYASIFYVLKMHGTEHAAHLTDTILQEMLENNATHF